MHYVSPTTYPAKLSPTSSRRESHISSTATAASSRSETVSSDEYPEHLTDNLLLPSIMAYKPLPRRLVTIRQDENVDFALYNNKHFSLEQETELCLSRIELRDSYSLDKMVDRAILFTYLGMRTAASLTTFLGNIHKAHAGQPQKQADIKHWFLNEIKKFETRPDHFSANRQANLVLMLRKFMEDGLVDAVDCSMYFSSRTLKTLDIIPSTTWFDRRLKRWKAASRKTESSLFNSTTQQSNKIAYHYILETMHADNTAYGYLTLPLSEVLDYRHIFCSYLRDGVPAETIFAVIMDLWMDEIEHNNLFWLHLIEQCSGDLAIPKSTFILKVGSAFHQLVNQRYVVNRNASKKRKREASPGREERFRKVQRTGQIEVVTRDEEQENQGEKAKHSAHDGDAEEAFDDTGRKEDDSFDTSNKSTGDKESTSKTDKGKRKDDRKRGPDTEDQAEIIQSTQVKRTRRFLPRRCKSDSSSNTK